MFCKTGSQRKEISMKRGDFQAKMFLSGSHYVSGCKFYGRYAIKKRIITSKTLFWLTSKGRVALERPPEDVKAIVFRLEQLFAGIPVAIVFDEGYPQPYVLFIEMDEQGRIIFERRIPKYYIWDTNTTLPARQRKIKVVADNPEELAKLFGAVYNNSLFE